MQMLFKKIKDKIVVKEQDEYGDIVKNLQKISGLSEIETEECIRRLNSNI
jgi:hypothetical protein